MTEHDELVRRVLEALGGSCEVCGTAIRVVLENPHDRHAFAKAAIGAGYTSRRQLERRMRMHGFPPLQHLQDVLRLLAIDYCWVRNGRTLSAQAYDAGIDPTVLGRLVKRVTGQSWLAWRAANPGHDDSRAPINLLPSVHCGR